MMLITMTHYRAKGTVLVLSLLILLVLTIVGVASMTNVLIAGTNGG
jgi:Tfp pilus assembly protein PilX